MSAMQAEVYEAFRAADVPDDKALQAAVALTSALSKVEDEMGRSFTKRDADIDAIRKDVGEIKVRTATLQGDLNGRMNVIVGEMSLLKWMMGTTFAGVITILFRVFTH